VQLGAVSRAQLVNFCFVRSWHVVVVSVNGDLNGVVSELLADIGNIVARCLKIRYRIYEPEHLERPFGG